MDLGLKNKVALIGASSQGLGKAVAMELAEEGAHVIICGRNSETLINTAKEIEALKKGKVLAIQADLSIEKDRNSLLEKAFKRFGSIDILVTNTGGPPAGKFESFSKSDWDRTYELLLASTVAMIQRVLPGMKAKKWGRIIAITSQAVKQPVNNLILSNSVRASVAGLTKTLAGEFGAFNITVNNVMPGYTKTNRLQNLIALNPKVKEATNEIPLGRFAEPKEFAAAVVFLASERASYITGVSLGVDGGWIKNIM
jgi:3-oxoacyl-[acyl-carrier protein] reductase